MSTSFQDLTKTFGKIGVLSFGGPAGQIALMHRILVDEKKWLSEEKFLRALNFCMLLPGPEAHQLAVYSGWLLHGVRGGLMAGLLFLLPGVLVVFALSALYFNFAEVPAATSVLLGLKAAVLAIVIEALFRIGKKALTHTSKIILAGFAFVAIYLLAIPFPLIVIGAGLLGAMAGYFKWPGFKKEKAASNEVTEPRGKNRFFKTLGVGLLTWLGPLFALSFFVPPVFNALSVLFTKLAVVTFGGAYAVLAYLAQETVGPGWLTAPEMIDGLGLAETTPGPLILVVDYVGFMVGARGMEATWVGAILGTFIAVWATFVPSFLWIFLGAPVVEKIRAGGIWDNALSAVTAAVVGVILNLALWFGIHVLFGEVGQKDLGFLNFAWPDLATVEWPAVILFLAALIALFRFKIGIILVIGLSLLAGLGLHYLT